MHAPVMPKDKRARRREDAEARRARREAVQAQTEAERILGWLISDVNRLYMRRFEHLTRDLPLTGTQLRLLVYLRREPGMTQTELADLLQIEKAPLGRLLDRLESGGWIERRPDPQDRRAKRVHATQKFDTIEPRITQTVVGLFRDSLTGVSREELARLLDILWRVKRNLLRD